MRGERGFALVITLIVTALLVALLVEFINETYVDTSHSHNFVALQQAGVLAESGATVGRGLLELELGSNIPGIGHPDYSSFLDTWAQPIHHDDESGSLTITIEEESGKLNLNNVLYSGSDKDKPYPFRAVARNLFQKLKLTNFDTLTDSTVDWVSSIDAPPQQAGAKSPFYNALKPPYNVKGAKLQTVEELALVKGFSSETVAKLKPFVTVYEAERNEPSTKININTAPQELLASVSGMSDDLVTKILETRKIKPISNLFKMEGLRAPPPSLLEMVTCRGSVYRIHSEAKVGDSKSVVEAVVRISGPSSQILYWREY
jgi:general secretion pathway protein K